MTSKLNIITKHIRWSDYIHLYWRCMRQVSSSVHSRVTIYTPVIPRLPTRSATTNAERGKSMVTTVCKYFIQISAKSLSLIYNQIQGKCLPHISAKYWS